MNIVFVCAGNICRSASAELVMKRELSDDGRSDIVVWSAGLWAEVGHAMDEGSRARAEAAGLDGSDHIAQQFDLGWLATADRIVVLDRWVAFSLRLIARAVPGAWDKIQVAHLDNPWHESAALYDRVHQQIENLCAELVRSL